MSIIDALQYSKWSEKIFCQMNDGELRQCMLLSATMRISEMVQNVIAWNQRFEQYPQLIFQGRTADDVRKAHEEGRTAIFSVFKIVLR